MPRWLFVVTQMPVAVRPDGMPVHLVQLCPECGSGDIRWCNISVRPYCADCHTWGATNYGSAADATKSWNERLIRAGMIEYL